ncbi:unnamed protein product [Dibothriocephalus latus]|uniref:Uncharacterized protein n=1 Tax=Dibothriocephalus latus TaxID=60516 RepID=A0A3P7KXU4_DIBLA|nr:unnamed protein product [Dibothriocephalus latus]
MTPGAVDHATDTYQLSTFLEIVPHRLCPVSIAELPIGEEVFAVQEPKQSPAVDEGFLIKRQEEVLCVSEDPPEETGSFAWVRPLEELSEGRLGEEVVWTQELVSQRPVEVTNSSDLQKAPVGSQQQTFQGDDDQAFDLVKESRTVPDEASNVAEVLSEVSEPLCVEALKSSVRVLGEPLAFEKAHSYTSEDTGSRETENIVEPGDLTNSKQLEQAVEESIVAVEKAPSTCSAQLTQKRVRFAPAEVTEVWNDSDRVDSSYDKQSPPGKTSANQASFLPSDSHTLLPAEKALQFSVLETSVPIAEAEDTEESAHQFTPKVVECSPVHATEDDHVGTTENQPSPDAVIEEKVEKTTAAAPVHRKAPVFPAEDNNFEVSSEDAQQPSSAKTVLDSAAYPEGDYAAHNRITENQTEEENSSDLSTDYIPEEPVTETCISCGLLPETLQHFVFDQPPNYSDAELNVSGTATGALWQTREHLFVSGEETALVSDLSLRGQSPEEGKAVQSRAAEYPLANTLPEELAVISGRGDETPTNLPAAYKVLRHYAGKRRKEAKPNVRMASEEHPTTNRLEEEAELPGASTG